MSEKISKKLRRPGLFGGLNLVQLAALGACGGGEEEAPEIDDGGTHTPLFLRVGQSYVGTVEDLRSGWDEDWVRIFIAPREALVASVRAEGSSTLEPQLELRDSAGGFIASNHDAGRSDRDYSRLSFQNYSTSRATAYLVVSDFSTTGDYRLFLRRPSSSFDEDVDASFELGVGQPDLDDPDGGIHALLGLDVGQYHTGTVESGTDEDWVRISLAPGEELVATLQPEGSSGLDPVLFVRDAGGEVDLSNDDAGSDSQDAALVPLTSELSSRIFFNNLQAHEVTVYLSVEGYGGSTGDYQLILQRTSPDGEALDGDLGGDTSSGNSADNRLSGGEGVDRFVFRDDFGHDLIINFESGRDILIFKDFMEVGSFAEFYAASRQDGRDVVYDFAGDGENVLTLAETQLDNLTEANFVFEHPG